MALNNTTRRALLRLAAQARENAYAPYSGFSVGAALLAEDGAMFSGCNVENASYGLTICAERAAIVRAAAEGKRRFRAIAIVSAGNPPAAPCGACRQALAEFAEDMEILLGGPDGAERERLSLAELLPRRFGPEALEKTKDGQKSDSSDG